MRWWLSRTVASAQFVSKDPDIGMVVTGASFRRSEIRFGW
jgi:hypothetical protein